jgi:hypothetical protein
MRSGPNYLPTVEEKTTAIIAESTVATDSELSVQTNQIGSVTVQPLYLIQ